MLAGGMLSNITSNQTDYVRQGVLEATAEQVEALILLQEALLIVRGLLGESATHSTILSDLTATSASTRISLALTSKAFSYAAYLSCFIENFLPLAKFDSCGDAIIIHKGQSAEQDCPLLEVVACPCLSLQQPLLGSLVLQCNCP